MTFARLSPLTTLRVWLARLIGGEAVRYEMDCAWRYRETLRSLRLDMRDDFPAVDDALLILRVKADPKEGYLPELDCRPEIFARMSTFDEFRAWARLKRMVTADTLRDAGPVLDSWRGRTIA